MASKEKIVIKKSERRDSNPRQSRWQREALPSELLSLTTFNNNYYVFNVKRKID